MPIMSVMLMWYLSTESDGNGGVFSSSSGQSFNKIAADDDDDS